MKHRPGLVLAFFTFVSLAAQAAPGLPEHLQLDYTFSYGGVSIGKVTKTLEHENGDRYRHSMWTRPIGIARAFTSVEMFEEGRFQLLDKDIRPLAFTEQRKGDARAYQRTATFDWKDGLLRFQDKREQKLIAGLQDQSTVLYWFMLNPPPPPENQLVPITDAKDVESYTFRYVGRERIDTAFGPLDTVVVQRLSPKQVLLDELCRHPKSPQDRAACDEPVDDFTVWLAPSKHNVPVKLRKRKNNQTLTLTLDSMSGQWPSDTAQSPALSKSE